VFLLSGGTLEQLTERLGIKVVLSDDGKRAILNYSQIDSSKRHPIVRECRGLTLEVGTWKVVARGFPRFFNWGEIPEEDEKFDWVDPVVQEKADGSLMLVYKYDGKLRVNTRGSFAQGEPCQGLGKSWEELFWDTSVNPHALDEMTTEGMTWVFEFCSPYNKVVRRYDKPTAYLLSCFINDDRELGPMFCDDAATHMGVERPRRYKARTKADLDNLLALETDPTFEGFVVRDRNERRVKVKSAKYVALHHMKGEGDNLFAPKNLVPFILGTPEEKGELLTYFPEVKETYERLEIEVKMLKEQMLHLWESAKGEPTQKEFAIKVKGHPSASFLFDARKRGVEPEVVWKERAAEFLIKFFPRKAA
jgi:hypothetical protein